MYSYQLYFPYPISHSKSSNFIQSTVHRIGLELDDGKIYRKPLYLMVKTMVSCRFSLEPIELWIRWALQLSGVAGSLGHRSRRAALEVALGSPADAAHGAAPSANQRYGLCGVPGLRAYWETRKTRGTWFKHGGKQYNVVDWLVWGPPPKQF